MTGISIALRRSLTHALDLLLPRFCLGCARSLAGSAAPLLLCTVCTGRLEPVVAERACAGCLRPLPAGLSAPSLCLACRAAPPPFDGALALWRFRPPIDSVLKALKYRGLDFLGPALAREAAARLSPGQLGALDRVAPVPLGPLRFLARGFNQSERIARPLAARLGLRFARPLRRRAGGTHQAGAGRLERQWNASRAFSAGGASRLAGLRILLVDDVFTTGATARAAAAALRASGALSVRVLAIAATPPRDGSGPA